MNDKTSDDFRPEIFVALCGAAGTDLAAVSRTLGSHFQRYGYKPVEIRISELFSSLKKFSNLKKLKHEDERLTHGMNAGRLIREKMNVADAAARMVI